MYSFIQFGFFCSKTLTCVGLLWYNINADVISGNAIGIDFKRSENTVNVSPAFLRKS